MSLLKRGVDTYVLYRIVRRISTPFTNWSAYKLGVIDERGNFLIPKKDRTPEQYSSLTYFDIFVRNLKMIMQKIPGLNSRIVTYAGALWLLREDRYQTFDMLTEDGEAIPANNSSGDGLARSSEGEATAFTKKKRRIKAKVAEIPLNYR